MGNGITAFNALECVQDLRKAGFTQEQAEVQARHIEKVKADLETHLATKKDIEQLVQATKKDIEQLAQATKKDLQNLKNELLWKLTLAMAALLGAAKILNMLPSYLNN